jgi:SAM-dependent methyltransferase
MGMDANVLPLPSRAAVGPVRAGFDLFLISLLLLFLELACIRWFPAHVLFLTFFTNVVLLASFLGMSVGCLTASRPRNYLVGTPALLALGLGAAHLVNRLGWRFYSLLDVGNQKAPEMVYFGAWAPRGDVAHFVIPIEVVSGLFFLIIALAFVGPGQELGRALGRPPNRLLAYTLNILGSMAGIALFAACSWLELSPLWWFLPVVAGLGYFLVPHLRAGRRLSLPLPLPARLGSLTLPAPGAVVAGALLLAVLGMASWTSRTEMRNGQVVCEHFWSPYYRIDYNPGTPEQPARQINVNLIGHQTMAPLDQPHVAYALPHLLNRDAGGQPFQDVLIIGAGSGNDVARALQWGARHVDAVEIDPVIQRLGQERHPDHPYQDPRVTVHLDDGRNFLHTTDRQYDLVIYALVDSLVLHSSYSNLRLESYLFTRQAFQDVRRRLKPGGLFVTYNFYRQGWIVARIGQGLKDVFGDEPLVLSLPYEDTIRSDEALTGHFTVLCAGATGRLRGAFERHPTYWLAGDRAPDPARTPDGFGPEPPPEERGRWLQFGLARVVPPAEPLRAATDDWPFLYLRGPMIPNLSLRGMAIMGGVVLGMLLLFRPRAQGGGGNPGLNAHLFFLGAGFMLLETKAVVQMALLFGSTWMVNSLVFFAVLLMILAANLVVLRYRPRRLWPYYVGLMAMLAVNLLVPLDFFLGMSRPLQVVGSSLLVSLPILFAGVIFAVSFGRTAEPERALGANIAGAMLGGLAEYCSMLLGFQYILLVAVGFYALSALLARASRAAASHEERTRVAA